jgi:hypothetical protein
MLDAVNGLWAAGQYANGGYDAFNSDTLSAVSGTANQTYDPVNRLYVNLGGYGPNRLTGGTASASAAESGYSASNAVDGTTTGSSYWDAGYGTPFPIWWQYDLGAGNARSLCKWSLWTYSNQTQSGSISYSDDGASWSVATTFSGIGGSPAVLSYTPGVAHRYWRITFSSYTGNGDLGLYEVQAFEALNPPSMTLVDAPLNPPPASAPAQALLTVLWKDLSGTARLNTDFTAEITANGGTTWAMANLFNTGIVIGGYGVLTATVPLSGGTSVQYRLKTFNNRSQQVKAVGLMTL